MAALVVAAGVLLSAPACGSSSSGARVSVHVKQSAVANGDAVGPVSSFSWSIYAEPSSLDWLFADTYPPNTVLSNVCESLMRQNPDFSLSPSLASSVDHPDPLTWIYHIRQGVKFHDGGTMTAADAAYSLNRTFNPKNGGYWGYAFLHVKSIQQSGPDTVTVKLSQPNELFNEFMATSAGTVESKAFVASEGKSYGTPQGGVDCTGPYSLANWDKGNSIILKAFPGYWDKALTPHAQQVTFKFLEDPSARAIALRTGTVDGAYYITPAGTASLAHVDSGKLYYGKNITVRSLFIFDFKGALKSPKVREALSIAIDRNHLIGAAVGGRGQAARAPVGPDSWSYARQTFESAWDQLPADATPNLSLAKKLLQEAGGAPKQPIVIASSNSDPSYGLDALEVQAAGRSIGLNVKIKTLPIQVYNGLFSDPSLRKGIDLYQTTWYLDIPDPLEFYGLYSVPGLYNNLTNFTDAHYTKISSEAFAATDPDQRARLTAQLQKFFVGNTVWIPLYQIPTTVFLNKRLAGAPTSSAYLYYPWAAKVGKAG